MKVAHGHRLIDVLFHGQLSIELNTKVLYSSRRLNCSGAELERPLLGLQFLESRPRPEPNHLSEKAKNGIFHLMQFYLSDILRYVAVCNIICYYESCQLLSNDAETGDLERRMWLSNVRKLFQTRAISQQ